MAYIYHLKYQPTLSGFVPKTESIVTDIIRGEMNEIASRPDEQEACDDCETEALV
jgi:hypothetical protein